MDKAVVVYIYNGILFSHDKEGHLAISDNMYGPWRLYVKCDKSDRERQVLYIDSKMVVIRGWGLGE